jgi:hypothetical protein
MPDFMRRVIFLLAFVASYGGAAHAAMLTPCYLATVLTPKSVAPGLAKVVGTGHAPLTPSDPPPGKGIPYLIQGDEVIALMSAGPLTCGAFISANKAAREIDGWIASASLSPSEVKLASLADWVGQWNSGPEQTITFKRDGNRLKATGDASWGASDPARVARGGVNTGELNNVVTPADRQADYADGTDSTDCQARFWRLGPYLVVSDNGNCGGHNVSFSGIYRRVGRPPVER